MPNFSTAARPASVCLLKQSDPDGLVEHGERFRVRLSLFAQTVRPGRGLPPPDKSCMGIRLSLFAQTVRPGSQITRLAQSATTRLSLFAQTVRPGAIVTANVSAWQSEYSGA